MKKFVSSTIGKVTIITVVILLVLCVFLVKNLQEEKTVVIDMEPSAAIEEWTQEGLPVFIDFTADWCTYCKEMEPIVENLKQQYEGKINFVTVDIDEQTKIAQAFGVSSVPLFIIMDAEGKPLSAYPGATTQQALEIFIEESLYTESEEQS